MQDAFSKGGKNVEYHDYYKYRISYITEKDLELMFLFVTGLTDNFENIKKELVKCKKEFLNLFEDILQHKFDAKTFEIFDPTIDSIHRNLRPKISLVGFSGVGKTTITRLIKAEEIPMEHIPTITGDIATIKIGKLHFHLWDFAGQEQFSYLWNNFIKGSDAVLLITDSSLENVEKSKFFLELIKEQASQAHTSVIGNKQDLDNALKPEQIEKILGLKTYSMIAKDSGNRDKMITIIADILEMSSEVSPLLQPLLERDIYTEKALTALENAKFEEAAMYFEKISDLCIELGDDSLGKEFYEKSQKIKSMILAASKPQEEPVQAPTIPKVESHEPVEAPTIPKVEPPKPVEAPVIPKVESPEPVEAPAIPIVEPLEPIEATVIPKVESPESVEAPAVPKVEPATPKEVPPNLKKTAIPESPKIDNLVIPKIPSATPTISSTQVEEAGKEMKSFEPEKPIEQTKIGVQEQNESEIIFQPKIEKTVVGLNLNPEDFMVKQRPKSVSVVPKGAKDKLKTSPFGHVSNPMILKKPPTVYDPSENNNIPKVQNIPKIPIPKISESQNEPTVPSAPASPPILVKPSSKLATPKEPSLITPPKVEQNEITTDIPAITAATNAGQKADLEKSLMDLKIKKSSITKMSLDFDMKELTGEITEEELKEKKNKLSTIEKNITEQIKEIEKLLGR